MTDDGHGPGGILLQPKFLKQLVADLPDSALPGKMRDANTWSCAQDMKSIALMRLARKTCGLPATGVRAGSTKPKSKASKDTAQLALAGMCLSNAIMTSEKHVQMSADDMKALAPAIEAAGKRHPMHEHIIVVFVRSTMGELSESSHKFEAMGHEILRWARAEDPDFDTEVCAGSCVCGTWQRIVHSSVHALQ